MGFWWLFSCQEGLGQWLRAVLVRRSPNLGGCHCRRITGILCSVHSGLFFPPFFIFFFDSFPPSNSAFQPALSHLLLALFNEGAAAPTPMGLGLLLLFSWCFVPPRPTPSPCPSSLAPMLGGDRGGPQRGCGAGVPGEGWSKHKAQAPGRGALVVVVVCERVKPLEIPSPSSDS